MKKTPNEVLAENLGRLMTKRKLNNTGLAKKAELAPNTIKNYRNPDRDGSANLADLDRLARALDVDISTLISEHVDGDTESPAEAQSTDLRMTIASEAVSMLAGVLGEVDEDGRSIVAPAIRAFALNPEGASSRLMKAIATALDAPLPPSPPPSSGPATTAATKAHGRASLAVKEGGGDSTQSRLPLPSSLKKIIDNTSPASLRNKLDNRTASEAERTKFHAAVKNYPKASE